jgi:hypothetical protein
MWMASLRGSVGCEAFLGIPAHTCCSRDAPPCSAKLEHPVNILHRITDTLGGISVPSSVSMDLSFDCMTDSRGGIGSMEKLNSHLIEPADTKNHCQCSLRRCLGDTDMCGHHVIIVCLLQTRRGHLPRALRGCRRDRNGAPSLSKRPKKVHDSASSSPPCSGDTSSWSWLRPRSSLRLR